MRKKDENQKTILENNNNDNKNKQYHKDYSRNIEPDLSQLTLGVLTKPPRRQKNRRGRSVGSENKATMDVKIAKKRFVERVVAHTDELFNAQLSLARGSTVLMVTRTTGKGSKRKRWTEMVEDPYIIQQYLDNQLAKEDGAKVDDFGDDNHYYFMTTRAPDNKALDSLLNRAFGKASEKIEIEGGFFAAQKMVVEIIDNHKSEIEDGTNHIIEAESETEVSI